MEEKLNQLTFTNAAIFGVLIAVAYFFFLYAPSNPENVIARLNEELNTARAEISKLDRGIKEGQVLKQEIGVMAKNAEKVYAQLSEGISVQQAAGIVSTEARTVGLSIESISSSNSWNKKKTVAVVDVGASVKGSFSQIMVFLSELTRDNKVYSISEFTIKAEGGSGAKSEDLNFNAKIQAYRKLSLSEIKKKEALNE